MGKIKEWIAQAADWIKSNKWRLILGGVLAILALALWLRDCSIRRELSSLSSAYAQSVERVKTLEAETQKLKTELDRKREEIVELQKSNDKAIREVTGNAYRKARNLSDAQLLDAYNALIAGARSRNAERERTDTSAEE